MQVNMTVSPAVPVIWNEVPSVSVTTRGKSGVGVVVV